MERKRHLSEPTTNILVQWPEIKIRTIWMKKKLTSIKIYCSKKTHVLLNLSVEINALIEAHDTCHLWA
jgi:hypothetical protein